MDIRHVFSSELIKRQNYEGENIIPALISLIAGGAMAQDCTFFFPQTEGTVWVRKGYDAKGNLQSVMSYQVDEVETLPSGQEVEADYVYTNPSGRS